MTIKNIINQYPEKIYLPKLQMISELLLPNVKLSNAKANTLIINKVFDSLFSQEKRKETINAKSN